jgi:phosphoserine phosphatase
LQLSRFRLVSFDLDGTLVKGRTFLLISRNLGYHDQIKQLDARFGRGEISLEECITKQFRLMSGLPISDAYRAMDQLPTISGIPETVRRLKARGLELVVLTDNPDVFAKYFVRHGFDDAIGSKATVVDGRISGELVPLLDKSEGLGEFIDGKGVGFDECVHVGDWRNDIAVFNKVGYSIALNAKDASVERNARCSIRTENLIDVATQIESLS